MNPGTLSQANGESCAFGAEIRFRARAPSMGTKPSFLGCVQIVAPDVENAIPTGAIIFERDLPAQLH